MTSNLKLQLPDDLHKYATENSGDGTLFVSPSEFIRSIIIDAIEQTKTNISSISKNDQQTN